MGKHMSKTSTLRRSQLLSELRAYSAHGAVKRAALGGEQDSAFEQSFASLAHVYIQDKAPGLLDFMIGFQLVDKSEDNTKAVGIFGFKIGQQWAYVPVFFLNGDIKGHELLYLRGQDSFVPLKENWINYLLAKRPHVLGGPTAENEQQLGILQPMLSQLSQAPSAKFGSDRHAPYIKEWARPVMLKLAEWVTKNPGACYEGLDERLDYRNFLKQDLRLVKLALDTHRSFPTVKAAADELYGPSMLRDLLVEMRNDATTKAVLSKSAVDALDKEEARSKVERKMVKRVPGTILAKDAAADDAPKVEVIVDSVITENLPEMDDEERKKLLRDGYLIRDHRNGEEVSIAYNVQIGMALSNPDQTDVYRVLTKPGTFERCLIIHHPHSGRGREPYVTVVALDGEKSWDNIHPTRVFVRQQARGKSDVELFNDWFEAQSSATSLQKGAVYVAISVGGQGTVPFEVRERIDADTYAVEWESHGSRTRAEYLPDTDDCCSVVPYDQRCEYVAFNTRKGTQFRSQNQKLYLPSDTKVIKIKDAPKCKSCNKGEDDCTCEYFRRDYNRGPEPIRPGNIEDLQLQIMSKTAALKVWAGSNEVIVNRRRMSKLAGLVHLVRDQNLRENQAKHILKTAERQLNGVHYRVKHAQPFMPYEAMQGPGAPAMMEMPPMSADPAYGGVPTQYPMEQSQMVPEMSAANTDPSIYDPMQMMDPMAMQTAQSAQQQGQKEVFDTTMIGSMLKAVREDTLVDRYLGDLIKALDRLGRILFMFYWHNEEFVERYGKQEMPDLEDTVRNAFEILGDLVLWMREKSVKPTVDGAQFGAPNIEGASRS